MKTVQILEPQDNVEATDWCRPLQIQSMSGGHSDNYSFVDDYGFPDNNAKWIKVEDIFGPCWFGKPASELQKHKSYEFIRGDIPESHQLRGHDSLAEFFMNTKTMNGDNSHYPVESFEVMQQTGEYSWEMSCGPYETYEDAEKARQGWFKKDEIPHMRVVQFYSPNNRG